MAQPPVPAHQAVLEKIEKKKEKKNPPLLYNLAELQNDCSRMFKISPDETLRVVQELYEKKLVTYPRTDARVLSTAVAKEISRNLKGSDEIPDGSAVCTGDPGGGQLSKELKRPDMSMTSRSPTIMRSFRPVRDYRILADCRRFHRKSIR